MRPLDFLPSIKLKLGVVIVAAVATTVAAVAVGSVVGLPLPIVGLAAGVLALVMVQLLARGMTAPLREMARAARRMEHGDHEVRVTATSQDEVGELARAFNAMAAELAEVDRTRRDLIANVSHELRTPLGALRATLENLVDGVGHPDDETLSAMLHQVERLSRLVAQILDLSRLEAGVVPLDPRPVDLGRVLLDAADDVRLAQPRASIEIDVPAETTIEGDPDRLRQVVVNLLDNAVRHSPPGGTVTARAMRDGATVRITVDDEGPGIAPSDADRVFERFYRADVARPSDGSSGLGLSIARWIVDLHGGDVRLEPRTPTGCRAVVELPREGRS